MNNETIFRLCNLAVLPAWLLLLVLPKWKWTIRIAMFTVPGVLALAYIGIFIANFEGLHANFDSLGAVVWLFQRPGTALDGWIHFLAFDLFVGAWMVRDAQRLRLVHLAVIPCLLLTILFGPSGLLLYFSLRGGLRKKPETREESFTL